MDRREQPSDCPVPYPPSHTYTSTISWPTRVDDPAEIAQEATKQGRVAQRALENLVKGQSTPVDSINKEQRTEQEIEFASVADRGFFRREKARKRLMQDMAARQEVDLNDVGPIINWEQQFLRPP